jgi:hypothetical protein
MDALSPMPFTAGRLGIGAFGTPATNDPACKEKFLRNCYEMGWMLCLILVGVVAGLQTECRDAVISIVLVYLGYVVLESIKNRQIDNHTGETSVSRDNK